MRRRSACEREEKEIHTLTQWFPDFLKLLPTVCDHSFMATRLKLMGINISEKLHNHGQLSHCYEMLYKAAMLHKSHMVVTLTYCLYLRCFRKLIVQL